MNLVNVEFPTGIQGSFNLPQSKRVLKNCWNANGKIIQRPGISEKLDTGKSPRCHPFEWGGELYTVVTQDLIRINTDNNTYVTIGNISGTSQVEVAIGFNEAVILVRGGDAYTLDLTETLTKINSPQFVASNSVTHINGRFVYVPSDGSPAFFSDVGDANSIQITSFFDAEELPDKNAVCVNLRNVLYIGGSDSFEQFRDFGTNPVVPFSRLNARTDNGYISGLIEHSGKFLFIGREKGQDVGVYMIAPGISPKISNEYIDVILKTYSEEELSRVIVNRFKWNGYDVATFTFARHSFGYFGGGWIELDTMESGVNGEWKGGYIGEYKLKYYSSFGGKIGILDSVNTDYSSPFERAILLGFESDDSFSVQNVEYRLSQGFNGSIGSVMIETSHDNVLFGPKFHSNTGLVGEYANKLRWTYPGGLGYYDGFMGLRISTAENIDFSATRLTMELR